MTEGFKMTEQLVPVDTALVDAVNHPSALIMPGRPVGLQEAPVQIVDKRAEARQAAAEKAQVAKNVTNLAAANWWHAQAAEQRGDHVAAAQHGIARGRLMAAAKAQGLTLG